MLLTCKILSFLNSLTWPEKLNIWHVRVTHTVTAVSLEMKAKFKDNAPQFIFCFSFYFTPSAIFAKLILAVVNKKKPDVSIFDS